MGLTELIKSNNFQQQLYFFISGAFHVKSIKNGEIYMAIFNFDEIGVLVYYYESLRHTNF